MDSKPTLIITDYYEKLSGSKRKREYERSYKNEVQIRYYYTTNSIHFQSTCSSTAYSLNSAPPKHR